MFFRSWFFTILLAVPTASPADAVSRWSGSAEITFAGTSTLHDWSGTVRARPFVATVTLDEPGAPKRVQAGVTVAVAEMDTAEPKRDANLRRAMRAAEHPLIAARIDASTAQLAVAAQAPTQLPMILTLLGRELPVTASIRRWQRAGDRVRFDLDFPVSMQAAGIRVPPVLFFLRVGDAVQVHAEVTLTQS